MDEPRKIEFTNGPRKGEVVCATSCWGGYSLQEPDGTLTYLLSGGDFYRVIRERTLGGVVRLDNLT